MAESAVNVVYAADDGYAEIMGVSILSLLETNQGVPDMTIYIVEDGIGERNITKLTQMIHDYGRKVVFIKKPDFLKNLGVDLKTARWSESAYSRLFLQDLFAPYADVHKLLYLDCDTLIVADVRELWNTDISDWLGAACLDCMGNLHKRIIGAKKTDNYFNDGVLLLNLDRWKNEGVQRTFSAFIQKHKGKTEYVDQGVFNGTVSNRFLIVDPRYNLTTVAFDFSYEEIQIYRKPRFGYSEDTWNKALSAPAIIHFTTSFLTVRPWFEGSEHPYAARWKETHDRSPWADSPEREMRNRSAWERKERLFRKFPRRLAVHIAGFFHAYVKPMIYVLMHKTM